MIIIIIIMINMISVRSARVWADDVLQSSLIYINTGTELLNDGCWSTARPSLFFLCKYTMRFYYFLSLLSIFVPDQMAGWRPGTLS